MKLIKPTYEILHQESGLEGIYRQIEIAGRTCYKSSPIEGKAKDFVDRMINSGHGAMLEHGTVYLKCHYITQGISNQIAGSLWLKYNSNKYSKAVQTQSYPKSTDGFVAITTNLRVLVENNWLDDLKYLCEPTEYHEKRITVRFICDRGVSHEFVRHRVFSFAQESTRYCNYSKDKFGNELTFIIPSWSEFKEGSYPITWDGLYGNCQDTVEYDDSYFFWCLAVAEKDYFKLLEKGWVPQQARSVLPNSLKTELIMTGFTSDWKHFFDLRALGTTGTPHPDARALAEPLRQEFIKLKLI